VENLLVPKRLLLVSLAAGAAALQGKEKALHVIGGGLQGMWLAGTGCKLFARPACRGKPLRVSPCELLKLNSPGLEVDANALPGCAKLKTAGKQQKKGKRS
jgi:hypothetical protein